MSKIPVSRRHIFINKSFQGRFIAWVIALIIVFGLCSAALIYWLISNDLHVQSQAAHINIANTWERLGISILIGNIVAAVIAGLMAVIVVMYISHKIAGPLYRFETLCKQVGDGNFETITHLRANDQLQELAISFSAMVEKLRGHRNETNKLIQELEDQLNRLNNQNELMQEQKNALETIESIVDRLKKSIKIC